MTAVAPNDNLQKTERTKIVCIAVKKQGLIIRDCREMMDKEREKRNGSMFQNTEPSSSKTFALRLHCQRKKYPPENVGAVTMPLKDPNNSNETNQQTVQEKGRNRKF